MHRRANHTPAGTRTGAALGALTLAAAAAWTMTTTTEPGTELVSADGSGAVYDVGTAFLTGEGETVTTMAGSSGDSYTTLGADARVVVPVASTSALEQTLTLTYASDTHSAPELLVNGRSLGPVDLPATDGWAETDTGVTVPAGLGSVELRGDGATAIALDRIALSSGARLDERGATVPYTAYQAQDGATNAQVLGPGREFRTVEAEASGRQAVRLSETGDHVEFELTEDADALVVRYSLPDAENGGGERHTLGLYADGEKVEDLELTSEYSWVYGTYPYSDDPREGGAQRFFDDSRFRVGPLPAGTTLRLEKDAGSSAEYYDIDLVETEVVPDPLESPEGFVDLTDHGAGSGPDDTEALRSAIAEARSEGTGVWVPEGEYTISDRVEVEGVTVSGAGPWYSVLHGLDGKGGFMATGSDVVVTDLMIDGDNRYRDDAGFDAAFEGDFGTGSLIQNVWIEHTKVGLWADHGTDGLLALGLRIRNTFADGVNLHGDVRDTEVRQSVVRNTGDDALAMWSDGSPVTDSAFSFNTVSTPLLGNGAGIYGGHGNRVEDNLFSDTLTGSAGIAVGTRFDPVPLSGETMLRRNTLTRTGGYEPNWETELGAIWVFADTADITAPITVADTEIVDSSYQGILVSHQRLVEGLSFENVTVDGTGSHGVEIEAEGSAYFEYVSVSGAGGDGLVSSGGFEVVRGEGNSGF
ncbi:glycosyl hydrolase family 28-related protein [Nocardiopsis ganjiahuensis]|uniref:glycosyl hydrolase family 28-related protein n=1 Tax=Nocardiopsis ganjiahuensis TaxID=239984 RepID=UPI00034A9051|nr:glycosyl hydrolase family 28-related protein [Nocardiopsis ganjiahuensis]